MSALEMSQLDLEEGGVQSYAFRRSGSDGGSVCFSDADDGSCYSMFYSTAGGSYDDESRFDWENGGGSGCHSRRISSASDSSSVEIKVHLDRAERDCRICHLSLESVNHESGIPIELGCSCKEDLAAAHKNCAEAWFKIKGNKTCEICNSVAHNVVGVTEVEPTPQSSESNNATAAAVTPGTTAQAENRSFWHAHRFLNFLLACMVFAFVISWLFHFNVPS